MLLIKVGHFFFLRARSARALLKSPWRGPPPCLNEVEEYGPKLFAMVPPDDFLDAGSRFGDAG